MPGFTLPIRLLIVSSALLLRWPGLNKASTPSGSLASTEARRLESSDRLPSRLVRTPISASVCGPSPSLDRAMVASLAKPARISRTPRSPRSAPPSPSTPAAVAVFTMVISSL